MELKMRIKIMRSKMNKEIIEIMVMLSISSHIPCICTENVAYGKPASSSSRYVSSNVTKGPTGPACVAVNGRTAPVFRYTRQTDTNCLHSNPADSRAWWQVDLGQDFTITDITVYNVNGTRVIMPIFTPCRLVLSTVIFRHYEYICE